MREFGVLSGFSGFGMWGLGLWGFRASGVHLGCRVLGVWGVGGILGFTKLYGIRVQGSRRCHCQPSKWTVLELLCEMPEKLP